MSIQIIKTSSDYKKLRKKWSDDVGFVPTMGNLHLGHLSLLEESLKNHQHNVLSIFVNPTQFGVGEDFNEYPRTLEEDISKACELLNKYPHRNLYVFTPSNDDIYPAGFKTVISLPEMAKKLEGEFRPTHFDGVATVVYLLFKIVRPKAAYFGQKDYQQLALIQQMTKDLLLDVDVIGLPIVRENDGLAMSSRNQYLDERQRSESLKLSQTINKVEDILKNDGIDSANTYINQQQQSDPNWNYLRLQDASTLREVNNNSKEIVILGTYQLGKTRLLDNKVVTL